MTSKTVKYVMLLGALYAASGAAQQQPTERGGSPYDRNPACADRDVSSTDPACVIQSNTRPAAAAPQPQTVITPTNPNVSGTPSVGNTPQSPAPSSGIGAGAQNQPGAGAQNQPGAGAQNQPGAGAQNQPAAAGAQPGMSPGVSGQAQSGGAARAVR